jgi:hypothetical protein
MKKLVAILLLTAAAAFSQATVTVEHVAPNCVGLNFLDQLSSGCFWPKLQVTAHSSNAKVIGFLIVVSYRGMDGIQNTVSAFAMSRDLNGNFVSTFPVGDVLSMSTSALELLAGDMAVQ